MSRSYKRSPICKDRNDKAKKRQASKAVRRTADVPGGNRFKMFYCSWDIRDWRSRGQSYTVEQFRRAWFDPDNKEPDRAGGRLNCRKTAYRFWLGGYKRK